MTLEKQNMKKINDLGLSILLGASCENLGSYSDEEIKNWRLNLLDHGSIYEIITCNS